MSITQPVAAEGGSGFAPPGPGSFELPPIFGDVTKPMVLLVLSAVVVFGFFYAATRNASLVPGRLQFAGEMVYGFVRNNMARDNIGSEQYNLRLSQRRLLAHALVGLGLVQARHSELSRVVHEELRARRPDVDTGRDARRRMRRDPLEQHETDEPLQRTAWRGSSEFDASAQCACSPR